MSETTGPIAPADQLPLFTASADALDDVAAEVDTAVPADAVGDDVYTDDEPAFSGVCRGGPYAGRTIASRFPGGFLLYDKQNRRLWTYQAVANRAGDWLLLHGGPANATDIEAIRPAAAGVELDVLAYDDGPAIT
jgi:hypothetical protein